MDPSTAAAVAAVAIAVLAFVVAFAQVLQQYFQTGSLLRLCDNVVYGGLPGRGRRIWQAGQFRFRVVYTLPRLRLEKGFWELEYDDDVELHEYDAEDWYFRMHPPPSFLSSISYYYIMRPSRRARRHLSYFASMAIRRIRRIAHGSMQNPVAQKLLGRSHSLSRYRAYREYHAFLSSFGQFVRRRIPKSRESNSVRRGSAGSSSDAMTDRFEPTGRRSGEASWASFTRMVKDSTARLLRYEITEGDADRCPSDLPNVPMQVSLRDIVVLGLRTGMRLSSRYAHEYGALSMVGSAGYITSSNHPFLGTILHFAPSSVRESFRWRGFRLGSSRIEKLWVLRMKGCVPIAGQAYEERDRDYLSGLDGEWLPADDEDFRPQTRKTHYDVKIPTPPERYNERYTYPKMPTSKRGSASSFVNLPVSPSSLSTHPRNLEKADSHDMDTAQEAEEAEVVLRRAWSPVRQRQATSKLKGKDENSEDQLFTKRQQSKDEDIAVSPKPLMITSGYGQDFDRRGRHDSELFHVEESANGVLHSPSHPSKVNMKLTRCSTHEGSQSHTIQSERPVENDERTQLQSTTPQYEASAAPPSPMENARSSSDDYGTEKPDSNRQASDKESSTQGQQAKQDAQRQKRIRERGRRRRARRYEKDNRTYHIIPSPLDWRWLSQMDIIPNFWATLWSSDSDGRTSKGAISAVLEALSGHVAARTMRYISRVDVA
ncbi:MAG: hypothetical protein Q9226_007808, partial [Calogaya cf. arnoldii]